jgi:hypothetical protein
VPGDLCCLLVLRRPLADSSHTRALRSHLHFNRVDHSLALGSQTLAFLVAHLGHHALRERHLAAAAARFGRFVRPVLRVRGFALGAGAIHGGGRRDCCDLQGVSDMFSLGTNVGR